MPKEASYKGPIDLSGARPSTETSVRQGSDLTAFEDVLRDSWNQATDGKGLIIEIPLPEAAVKTVQNRFRQAAAKLDLGVAAGEKAGEAPGSTILLIQARTKRVSKPRTPKAEGAPKKAQSKGLPPVAAAS